MTDIHLKGHLNEDKKGTQTKTLERPRERRGETTKPKPHSPSSYTTLESSFIGNGPTRRRQRPFSEEMTLWGRTLVPIGRGHGHSTPNPNFVIGERRKGLKTGYYIVMSLDLFYPEFSVQALMRWF